MSIFFIKNEIEFVLSLSAAISHLIRMRISIQQAPLGLLQVYVLILLQLYVLEVPKMVLLW